MVENHTETEQPKSLISTLKAGFDVTTRHWSILIVPILLDCLLWLGPRFRFASVIRLELDNIVEQTPADFTGFQPDALEQFYQLIERGNLLSALSVPLVGIPALLNGSSPEKTPLQAASLEMASLMQVAELLVGLTLVGLLLSGIFYFQVATVINRECGEVFGRKPLTKVLHLFVLGILLFVVLMLLMFPIIFVATIAGLFSLNLAYFLLIGGSVVIMWGVIITSFSAQALMLDEKAPLQAIWHSVRFVRKNFGATLPLLLIVLVTKSLVENVMLSADSGSWLTAISILGHAFIATALLTATFIFYKNNTLTPKVI